MPNELTSKQCDAFMRSGLAIEIFHNGLAWFCQSRPYLGLGQERSGQSRQAAITAYCKRYAPDWTPPVEDTEPRSDVHDAEWALRYMLKQELSLIRRLNNLNQFCLIKKATDERYPTSPNWWTVTYDTAEFVKIVTSWKDEYDPDKPVEDPEPRREPTREETAMDVVREIVKANECGIATMALALANARDFLKAEGADERSEGSEADHVD